MLKFKIIKKEELNNFIRTQIILIAIIGLYNYFFKMYEAKNFWEDVFNGFNQEVFILALIISSIFFGYLLFSIYRIDLYENINPDFLKVERLNRVRNAFNILFSFFNYVLFDCFMIQIFIIKYIDLTILSFFVLFFILRIYLVYLLEHKLFKYFKIIADLKGYFIEKKSFLNHFEYKASIPSKFLVKPYYLKDNFYSRIII